MPDSRFTFQVPVTAVVVAVAMVCVMVFAAVFLRFPDRHPHTSRFGGWMQAITLASDKYRMDWHEYPAASSVEGLIRLLTSPAEGRGPYLRLDNTAAQQTATDPWGTPLLYERSPDGQSFRLGSAGPDREFGTEDDFFFGNLKDAADPAEGTF